jgi:hypothetical protein
MKRKEICCGATHASYNAMARISHQFAYELIGEHVRHTGPVDLALSPYSIISVLQVSNVPQQRSAVSSIIHTVFLSLVVELLVNSFLHSSENKKECT